MGKVHLVRQTSFSMRHLAEVMANLSSGDHSSQRRHRSSGSDALEARPTWSSTRHESARAWFQVCVTLGPSLRRTVGVVGEASRGDNARYLENRNS